MTPQLGNFDSVPLSLARAAIPIAKSLVINGNPFTETIHCLAWQHGDTMEVAAILGNIAKEGDDDIISAVTDMLKNAEKMPKK